MVSCFFNKRLPFHELLKNFTLVLDCIDPHLVCLVVEECKEIFRMAKRWHLCEQVPVALQLPLNQLLGRDIILQSVDQPIFLQFT